MVYYKCIYKNDNSTIRLELNSMKNKKKVDIIIINAWANKEIEKSIIIR